MQIQRLFEMVYLLLDTTCISANDFAKRFEVSVRTVYRDVELLSSSGIPIYMRKGRNGGISLLPDYILNKAVLTEEEKKSIIVSMQAFEQVMGTTHNGNTKHIQSLLGESDTNWIEIDFSSWEGESSESQFFDQIKQQILDQKCIEIAYVSNKSGMETRLVEPIRLCYRSGAWYLYGYCLLREDYRFFKLRRIRNLMEREQKVEHFVSGKVLKRENVFCEEFVNLVLQIQPEFAYRVLDEFQDYQEMEDGSYLATVRFPDNDWIYYYIWTFGSKCKVIEPLKVKKRMVEEIKKLNEMYLI